MGRSYGLLIAFAVLIAGLLLAFTVGRYPVGLGDLLHLVIAKLTGRTPDVPAAVQNVIWLVRGPRVRVPAVALYGTEVTHPQLCDVGRLLSVPRREASQRLAKRRRVSRREKPRRTTPLCGPR